MDTETVEAPISRGSRIDVLAKQKAKNLYLYRNASHEEISLQCGLTVKAVGDLVSRSGWAKLKRERERRLSKAHDARSESVDTEIIEAIASESEQHALRALQKTGEALERNDRDAAKDSQAYSATAKNLVGVARAIRDPASASAGEGSTNFNLFFMAAPAVAPQKAVEKIAEPIDVKSVT